MAETQTVTDLLDQMIQRYSPGGGFGDPERALLEREKTKSLARTSQNLVSRGLAGTTAGVGMGKQWEEEIGMPAKLRLEDVRSQRLMEALGTKAGYLERTEAQNRQIALEQYRIREQRPTLAEQGLDAFGQPMGPTGTTGTTGTGGTGGITTHAGGGSFSIDGSGAYDSFGSYGGGENRMDMYDPNKPSYDPTIGQPVLPGGPDEGKFVTSSGELSEGTMGGTVDQAWSAFRNKNPYYLKGKDYWLKNVYSAQ